MYNRYIPKNASYTPVEKNGSGQSRPSYHVNRPVTASNRNGTKPGGNRRGQPQGGFRLPSFLGTREAGGLSSLLNGLNLEELDSGDILLLLILLYLLVEGDDLELVIALGLVLIMGLGDKDGEERKT